MKDALAVKTGKISSSVNTKTDQPLRLEIAVSEGSPWPALKVTVHALLSKRMPLTDLQCHNGCFIHEGRRLKTDPIDGLILRTLMQQPKGAGGVFLSGAREFAPTLALLRQHSFSCDYSESLRLENLEIHSTPPDIVLEITQCSPPEQTLQVTVRTHFRCPETGAALGETLFRNANYWTFNNAICPPPPLPSDPVLRKIIEDANVTRSFIGDEALDVIYRARAAKAEDLRVRLDSRLASLSVSVEPLRENVQIKFDENGDLVVDGQFVTPDGKSVPAEAMTAEQKSDNAEGWVSFSGRAYRMPACAYFKAPAQKKISGDSIVDFIRDELPKLKARGAKIAKEVEQTRICDHLRPSLSVEKSELEPEAVQAQFFFEAMENAPAPEEKREESLQVAPLEILAAAANGQRYLRRGASFVRVDREAVIAAKREIEKLEAFKEYGEAKDEQIPELLAWAKKASANVQTPWNLYVAEAVDGAHKIKDEAATLKFNIDAQDEEGEPWFTLNATFDHNGVELSEDELEKLVKSGQKWFRKNDTWYKVDDEALKRFEHTVEKAGVQKHRNRARQFYYRFKPASRDRVTEIFSLAGTIQHTETYKRFLDQLRGFGKIQSIPMPKGMTLTLRPYQQQGYEWMCFLAHYGLNGILADDMGLGKTAQTITVLTRMKEQYGAMPALIVTPTSLVDNWRNEIAKFSPGLNVMIYRGSPQRRDKLRQQMHDFDVVLGTYATIRNDASLLREQAWRYVILDEAHFIKNSAAATTKAVKTIPAQHRLALTGTPIQNRLTELWSLFDFLMPDFLGRQMRFRDTYEEPIARVQSGRAETREEEENGQQAMERLRERIRPFILRRLKTDVASELPPKIENDVYCALSPEQIALYKGFSDSAEAKQAVNELIDKGPDGAAAAILAALTSLRKICNHPDLMCLPKNAGRQHITEPLPGYEHRSGKLEALGELLEQCREGGHRALIFCQQTSMMDLLAHYLKSHGMKWLRIDGETPGTSRQGLVEEFNKDKSIDAFLISTRAGGAGLNLTGADTVIFYDHDWNPANDQQAQDRAYRIGQQRTVNVYRLVCKGTLEEKILRRQAMKKMLADCIVQHDVSGMKNLTREELLSLFTLNLDEAEAAKSTA